MVVETTNQFDEAHYDRANLKKDQGAAVLDLVDQMVANLEVEDVVFEDAQNEDEHAPTTETEDDRDEAKRLTGLLEQQLLQFRQAAPKADAKIAKQEEVIKKAGLAAKAPADDKDNDPANDVFLEFTADINLLPKLQGTPQGEQKKQLTTLAVFFAAVP